MNTGAAIDLCHEALVLALILAGPVMAVGMLVGLALSVVQAVTQLQEQTLSLVPKIVAMGVTTAVFTPWLTTRLVEYAQRLWTEGAMMP